MQVDICNLASIKYDYIGYFERMAEDVKTVVDRFGGQHIDIFNFGINAHFTNTDKKLARLYDKVRWQNTFARIATCHVSPRHFLSKNDPFEVNKCIVWDL